MMYERTIGTIDLSGDFICEERHYECLNRARESLLQAQAGLNNVPLELVSIDLKEGWDALGEITGVTSSEEIINNIFSKFCVGK